MSIENLRKLSWVEGGSLLLLLLVAMPLKYLAGMPMAVRVVGSLHGLLWILFVGALVATWAKGRLSVDGFIQGIVTSVLPFGPLLFDRHLKKANPQL